MSVGTIYTKDINLCPFKCLYIYDPKYVLLECGKELGQIIHNINEDKGAKNA